MKKSIILCCLALVLSLPAFSQELNTIVITPSRASEPKVEIATSVTVLTQEEIESALPLHDYSARELELGLAEAMESYHIRSGGPKHLHQQASLVGHLRRLGALPPRGTGKDNNNKQEETVAEMAATQRPSSTKKPRTSSPHTFFEMGAGRGMLGLVAAGVSAVTTQPTHLVLVERSGSRSKADTVLRNLPKRSEKSRRTNSRTRPLASTGNKTCPSRLKTLRMVSNKVLVAVLLVCANFIIPGLVYSGLA